MSKIYYGCDELARGWKHYFRQCNALELDVESFDAPPKLATLNRWRVESPRGFCFTVRADSQFIKALTRLSDRGAEELDEAVRQSWQTTVERAHALAARAILIRTPPEFSPGSVSRTLLERVAEELAGPVKPAVIWESDGLWQLKDTRDFAQSIGLVYAFDPFIAHREEIAFTHGDTAWALTERAGLRRKLDQFDMETLIGWAENYDRVFCFLRGRFKWEHARELKVALEYDAE
jgi:uncharacterized protein YecE (DUF72 family)